LIETTSGQSTHYLPGLAQYGGNAWNYYLPDRLGSVRQLTDPSGAVMLARSYDPFGNGLEQVGGGQSVFGYTGEQTDPTGLVFLRARYYSPYLNRFISPDTIIPNPTQSQSWNRYLYVGNNPVNRTDPSGRCWGPASFLRDVPGYDVVCGNLDQAIFIAGHPQASPYEKAQAVSYVEWAAISHVVLAEGLFMGGYGIAVALCTPQTQRLSNIWNSPWWQRGRIIENQLGGNLPPNFPTIDRFQNGVATSIKSLDVTAPTYQNIGALTSKVQGYIDTLASFQGATHANTAITAPQITGRVLELAISPGASPAQMAAFQQLQQYASNVGVQLNIVVIP